MIEFILWFTIGLGLGFAIHATVKVHQLKKVKKHKDERQR